MEEPEETHQLMATAQPEEKQKLFRSVKFGKTKEVKEALDENPQLLSSVDIHDNTLLHMAAKNGHKNIVKELLRREIDVQAKNGDGKVCWELALQYNYKPLAQYIREKMKLPPLPDDGDAGGGDSPEVQDASSVEAEGGEAPASSTVVQEEASAQSMVSEEFSFEEGGGKTEEAPAQDETLKEKDGLAETEKDGLAESSVEAEAEEESMVEGEDVLGYEDLRQSPERGRPGTPPRSTGVMASRTPSRTASGSLAEMQLQAKITAMQAATARAEEATSELEIVVSMLWGRFGVLAGEPREVLGNDRLQEELRAIKSRMGEDGDVESVLADKDLLTRRAGERDREAVALRNNLERVEEALVEAKAATERSEEEARVAEGKLREERRAREEAEGKVRTLGEELEDERAALVSARADAALSDETIKSLKGGLNNLKDMNVPGLSQAELEALFVKHDADASGDISAAELRGLVEELCETFQKKVDAAKEEAKQEGARAEATQVDRDRHVERGKEHAALMGKQMKQLEEDAGSAEEAHRAAVADAAKRAELAKQQVIRRLDQAELDHEVALARTQEEHFAEIRRTTDRSRTEMDEARKAHGKEVARLSEKLSGAEEEGLAEKTQRRVAQERQREAQHTLDKVQGSLVRLQREVTASKSHQTLQALFALRKKLRTAKTVFRDSRRTVVEQTEQLRASFRELRDALTAYVTFILPLAHEKPEKVRTDKLSAAQLGQALKHMMGKYRGVSERCRVINAEMQSLKGSMRVYCRVRPLQASEGSEGSAIHLRGLGELSVLSKTRGAPPKEYRFDLAYGPRSSQEELFADAKPLLQTVVDGYNVSVFAYGPTGSGKTYTMTGDRASSRHRGLVYRMLEDMFATQKERSVLVDMEVRLSMFEIYNETVKDLLAPGAQHKVGWDDDSPGNSARDAGQLKITSDKRGNVHVEGLSEHKVDGLSRGLSLVEYGQEVRATGATNLNEHSSRSHLLIRIGVRTVDKRSGERAAGKMFLVDLAGSENVQQSGAEGKALKEAIGINKSLAALHDVMMSLSAKDHHVPYRNSMLTRVLADSLGGNAKCLMFVMVSPSLRERSITQATLKFAGRCKNIELAPAEKNADVTAEMEAEKAKEQAEALKAKLTEAMRKGKEDEGRVEMSKEIILEADRFEAKLREMFGFAAQEKRKRAGMPAGGGKDKEGGDRLRKKVEALYLDEASRVLVRRRSASDELLRSIARGVEALSEAIRQSDDKAARLEASNSELRSKLDSAQVRYSRRSPDRTAWLEGEGGRPGEDTNNNNNAGAQYTSAREARPRGGGAPSYHNERPSWDGRTKQTVGGSDEIGGRANSVPQVKTRTREALPFIGGGLG